MKVPFHSHGFDPPGPTPAGSVRRPNTLYEIKIDTNGDNVADIAYGYASRHSQTAPDCDAAPRRARRAVGTCVDGQIMVEGAPVSMDPEARITEAGEHRFRRLAQRSVLLRRDGRLEHSVHRQRSLHRQGRVQHWLKS